MQMLLTRIRGSLSGDIPPFRKIQDGPIHSLRYREIVWYLFVIRIRRWKIKRLLVNSTKHRLVARTENREMGSCYEQETEIDYVTQTNYTQELIKIMVLPIHYDVKTSFNHSLLCDNFIWYLDYKRNRSGAPALSYAWMRRPERA
ncbi:hypothetical protein AAHA92_13380 [Salvia divinorum]|uniref:Uncharacterized protein n=1 Tax=Salvia divinorum TaxID=28513 RepID=A0ABD1HAR2_SALDI